MNGNTDATDDTNHGVITADDLNEGDRVSIAYDSPQSETPVEKTGEVVKTWTTGYELVADEDDEDRRIKVVHSDRMLDGKGRARVTSKLYRPEVSSLQGVDWTHGAELGRLERSSVENETSEPFPDLDDEDDDLERLFREDETDDDPVTVREEETVEGYELPDAPDALDASEDEEDSVHEKPVSVRDAGGRTFAVVVSEEFGDGSTHTDHYTESQARAVADGISAVLNGEEPEDYEGDEDSVHEKPVSVRESVGSTYAVVVEETFGDGSTHTDYYTERQAREIADGITSVLGDEDEDEDEDEDDEPTVLTDGGEVAEDMESVEADEFSLGEAVHAIVQPLDRARQPVDLRGVVVEEADEDSHLVVDTGDRENATLYKFTASHVYHLPPEDADDLTPPADGFEELKGTSYTLFRDTSSSEDSPTDAPSACVECGSEEDVSLVTHVEETEVPVADNGKHHRDPAFEVTETRREVHGYDIPLCPDCKADEEVRA